MTLFQVSPESEEVQIFPIETQAASLVPSLEEVTLCQFKLPDVFSVQVVPESADLQMVPPYTTATIWVPSLDMAAPNHFFRTAQ